MTNIDSNDVRKIAKLMNTQRFDILHHLIIYRMTLYARLHHLIIYRKKDFFKLIFSTNLTNMLFHIFRIWEYDWNKKRSFSIANFPNLKKKCYFIFFLFGIFATKKKHFIFSKILPLNPIPVRGAESAPFGGFSCAAHLLNDLRSPNLVTFQNITA